MATINPTFNRDDKNGTGLTKVDLIVWSGLVGTTADVGKPVKMAKFNDKCVHIYGGTFGTSTLTLQGSNDQRADPDHASFSSAVWTTLTDAQGNAIAKTADSIEQLLENPLWIRPSLPSGTGTGIVVALLGRRG